MTKQRTILISVIAGVIVVAAIVGAYNWWWSKPVTNGVTQQSAAPNAQGLNSAQQEQKQREDAQTCLHEALQRIGQMEQEEPEQHDNLELEKSWLEYLQRIQAEGSYQNWSDRPCDLYLRNHPNQIDQAVAQGFATVTAQGNGLKTVQVSVTSTANTPVLYLPVGTLFTSSSSGTQSMIAAQSARFVFHPVKTDDDTSQNSGPSPRGRPRLRVALLRRGADSEFRNAALNVNMSENSSEQTMTQEVSSYCINRWLDVPESNVQFTVSQPEESSPLRKLVSCLADNPADHKAKQAAVWMLSDGLMDLTPPELADKFFAYDDEHYPRTLAEFMENLKGKNTDISEEDLQNLGSITPEQFDELRTKLLREQAEKEVQGYLAITRPLLEGCGIDLSGKAFFQ
jgi:hypothetical protein